MSFPNLLKKSVSEFLEDNATTQAAALAYYTGLSLAPLLVILLAIAGIMGPSAQNRLINELVALIGKEGGEIIRTIVNSASSRPKTGSIAGIIGVITLLFAATGVFAQIQSALNAMWDVKAAPGRRGGIWGWLRKRLLSAGMVLVVGFLLFVSTAASAALSAVLGHYRDALPGPDFLWKLLDLVVSLGVVFVLFAAMYRVLPDLRIAWSDVWVGALFTAVLFSIGKFLIGLYLGRSSIGSAYGAAGSLAVLLVWVYYSALVLFFGAEWTQVWARREGRGGPRLEPHAEPLDSGEPRRAHAGSHGRQILPADTQRAPKPTDVAFNSTVRARPVPSRCAGPTRRPAGSSVPM
jgi:membrane protein